MEITSLAVFAFICAGLSLFCGLNTVLDRTIYEKRSFPIFSLAFLLGFSYLIYYAETPNYIAEIKNLEQEQAAREHADTIPRLYREFDGCKVCTFKGGDYWHYFTRCPMSQVTTDTTYRVQIGKHSELRTTPMITTTY